MPALALMLQGTGSDVGKSLLVTGLCRLARRRGLAVRPFKPQNMSNNAAVADDGGEIGRAQALQARAAGVSSSIHMNPVLLKPETDTGAQIIVQGRMTGSASARCFHDLKPALLDAALDSFRRLGDQADLIIAEGAGSPAEINLRHGDIANMGFAAAADVPVILVGDIERGGVIASLVGTHAVLAEPDRARIAGYIVNKFRGDVTLFRDGVREIEGRTGWRCFGIVPWFADAALLPAEDSVGIERRSTGGGGGVRVAVPVLSRIANFDDLDPLRLEPTVRVTFVPPGEALPGDADVVLLPGSKSTIGDIAFLRDQGWDVDIRAHVRRGGHVLGLCGGYQMLGRTVSDPDGIEGSATTAEGLGLLEVETVLRGNKAVSQIQGRDCRFDEPVSGYEIHLGHTTGPDCARPMVTIAGANGPDRTDGACSPDRRIMGCYVHGLLAADGFRHAMLAKWRGSTGSVIGFDDATERLIDALADHLEANIAVDPLLALAS